MTTTVTTVISEVLKVLKDEVGMIFDPQTEVLPRLNRCVPAIVWADPQSNVVNLPFLCAEGVTQTLPPEAVTLVSVQRNLGPAGTAAGTSLTKVNRNTMDASRWGWGSQIMGEPGVPPFPVHWLFGERSPRFFDLWPQPNGPWYVQLEYSAVPDDVGIGDNWPLPDMYISPGESWMVANLLAGRREELNQQAVIVMNFHQSKYEQEMGISAKAKQTQAASPQINRP